MRVSRCRLSVAGCGRTLMFFGLQGDSLSAVSPVLRVPPSIGAVFCRHSLCLVLGCPLWSAQAGGTILRCIKKACFAASILLLSSRFRRREEQSSCAPPEPGFWIPFQHNEADFFAPFAGEWMKESGRWKHTQAHERRKKEKEG